MAQVRRIIDNVLITYPFDLTHQGIDGQVVVDDLGEGNQIYFKYGVNTDIANDVTEIVTHISMADFYSLNLTSADPEGVDPDAPLPELEPTRVPVFQVSNGLDYKTYIETGTYDNQTRINLFITNNEEDFDVEFSAFYHGSLSGSAGSYSPNTWATIARETDGSYYLILPSNDDTVPTPQPFWARFVGNTPSSFGAYVTFRTNGDDPLEEGGGGTPPVVGEDDAVVRTDFDLVWTVWGGFSGRDLNRLNDKPASKTHYYEMSAMSGSGDPKYRDQAPFYAYHTEPQQIDAPIAIGNIAPYHVNEPRYADVDWQMTENDMKMCNEYLIRSGFQCWNFTYYANTYQLAQMRNFFENLPLVDKRGITAFYSIGQLGGSRGGYRDANGEIDPTNDYTINLNYIVDMMGETWYKKIGGKPVIVYFNTQDESATDAQNLRAAYRSQYTISDPYPFYEIYMTFLADTDNVFVNLNNMQAKTWYYQTNNNAFSDHSLESSLLDSYNNFVSMGQNPGNASRDVVPSFNVALDGRARNEYPGDYVCIDNITPGTASYNSGINWAGYNRSYIDKSYSYYNPATSTDVASIVSKFASLKTLFGSRMKLAFVSTWDENSEGNSTGMPKLNLDGVTINDSVVEWFRSHYNSGYVNP